MKYQVTRWMTVGMVAAMLTAGAASWWHGGTSHAVAAAVAAEDGPDLNATMEEMDRRMRMLRRTLRNAERNEQSLQFIAELQGFVLTAKLLEPSKTASVPSGEREAFLTAYRRELAELLTKAVAVEIALLDGDNEKAWEIYEAIAAMEEPGHERFME